jgi:hypothetical protein
VTAAHVPRDLSFIGLIHAEPDLAERSEDILREEAGRTPLFADVIEDGPPDLAERIDEFVAERLGVT